MNSPAQPNSIATNSSEFAHAERARTARSNCEPLINAKQAAALLEVDAITVKRLATKGIIPGMRIGRLWRFRASSLDEWMKSQLQLSRHPCSDAKGEK